MGKQTPRSERLYKDLARSLRTELAEGKYPVGSRLPAERDLAEKFGVSRPTVREAMIALEVQGIIEVRVGSGAHVLCLPGEADVSVFDVSAFELTEARLLFEGEAVALAATQIEDKDIEELEGLVKAIAQENLDNNGTEKADREFHLTIASATRNQAIFDAIERLWNLREASPESALLHAKARTANIKPVVEEHTAILKALKARDAVKARFAMRAHLSAVLDSLVFATEQKAVAEIHRATQAKRRRYAPAAS